MRIAVEGPPGIGKSTLCRHLADHLPHSVVIEEPVLENLYLGDYYADPRRWALAMQVDLLTQRALAAAETGEGSDYMLYDRSLFGDRVFARAVREMGLMEPREYGTYDKVFQTFKVIAKHPDIIIYLQASPQVVWDRIQQRGRAEEMGSNGMTFGYLQKVCAEYEAMMGVDSPLQVPVVRVDWTEFQPADEVWEQVRDRLP